MTYGTRRGRLPRLVVLAAALSLGILAAPAASAEEEPSAKRVRSFLGLRHERVAIQQWDLSCGAATVTTLLRYQFGDRDTEEEEVAKSMLARTDSELVRKRLGFSLLDLKRELVHRGYQAAGYADVSLQDLLGMAPAIVRLQNPGFDHFVIVRGAAHGRIVMADPAYGNKTMPVERFTAVWQDKIAFVVSRADGARPKGELAVDPQEVPFVSPQALRTALP
jgi:predicted double-glycine peptidase